MEQHKKLGEILVENGIITLRSVERTLPRARKLGRKFGTILEELGLITDDELANALAIQLGYKVVKNLGQFSFPEELLRLLSVEVALQHQLFPLKAEKGWLALAMADPTNSRIIHNLSANTGLRIVPYVAARHEIYDAICRHYLGQEPHEGNRRTILVVEDEKLLLGRLREILAKSGFRVVTAMDGLEAYKMVIAEKPQVVLTDKEMPKMNGYGLLAAIRNIPELKSIPVILLTGRISDEEEASAFDKGFFDFISKPVRDVSLLTRVKRAFQYYDGQYRP